MPEVVRVSDEVHKELKKASAERGVTMGRIAEEAITAYLSRDGDEGPAQKGLIMPSLRVMQSKHAVPILNYVQRLLESRDKLKIAMLRGVLEEICTPVAKVRDEPAAQNASAEREGGVKSTGRHTGSDATSNQEDSGGLRSRARKRA